MSMWYRCTTCGRAEDASVIQPSVFDDRVGQGFCAGCRYKLRDFVKDSVEQGRKLKAEGQAQAEGHVQKWSDRARAWIEAQPVGAAYTSEDITADLGQPPSSGAVGAVMTGAAKRGLHRKYQLVKAERPNQHAAEIWRWIRIG